MLVEGKEVNDYITYLNTWIEAEKLARKHKNEEMNVRINEKWGSCKMTDGKKLWRAIDWKGKSVKEKADEVPPDAVHRYFQGIFQSAKTKNNPILKENEIYNCGSVEVLDMDITMAEVNDAFSEIGTGTSIDGIAPDILPIIPPALRQLIHVLYNRVFKSTYPSTWQDQLLLPHPKKGHLPSNPQLRGIAIGPVLSRVYDKILNKRFKNWYVPNKEQAGFRELMGCLLQIFAIYLLMELAKNTENEIYIAFMDYEKAFDFLSRKRLMDKLCLAKAGKGFIRAFHSMYEKTAYIPKISNTQLGEKITTEHGVTQGKESSANLYSFYVSDMPTYMEQFTTDYMDPLNLVQLADDTATLASYLESLIQKIKSLFGYSKDNYQVANVGKTKYLHLSKNPFTEPLEIDEGQFVESAHKKGYVYLGSLFISSNILTEHITANINHRMGNMHKFYAWLQFNDTTPIKVKLLVLYNCVFAAILYAAETWGDVTLICEKILRIERQALKRCLGVKSSTPNDLLYIELDQADIIANIRDRQYKFYQKLMSLEEDSAVILDVLEMCKDLQIMKYYDELHGEHKCDNLQEKKNSCTIDEGTYKLRYREITDLQYCPALYESFMREDLRMIITRWRLSCFELAIETGRYKGIPREERLCVFCNVIEDEQHAIYHCKAYDNIRREYRELIEENPTVKKFLNPKNKEMANRVGSYLKLIEDERRSLV